MTDTYGLTNNGYLTKLPVILIILSKLASIDALSESWRKELIGIPSAIYYNNSRIITSTESGILASIKLQDGSILWRKSLNCVSRNLLVSNGLIQTSCPGVNGNEQLKIWVADTGLLSENQEPLSANFISGNHGKSNGQNKEFQITSDQSIVTQPDGQVILKFDDQIQWQREESLASITATEIVHLPPEQRDQFGLRKMIVAVTDHGKIFGIESTSGQILWSFFDPELATRNRPEHSKAILIVLRQSDGFEHSALVINPNGHYSIFNPVTGEQKEKTSIGRNVKQIAQTEYYSNELGRAVLILDSDNRVHIAPNNLRGYVEKNIDKYFLTIVDRKPDTLTGYSFVHRSDSIEPKQIWNFPIDSSEEIVDVVIKRIDEQVHSPARVLGDRNILYKYLNPSLIAVMTQGDSGTPCAPDNYLKIYLLDGVTGALIHSIFHPKTRAPTSMVYCENWLVYHYYSTKHRRTEISSLELFDGSDQVNSTAFSSISRSAIKPKIAEHKSYIFGSGIELMTDTVTLRGLTNKHLIVGLSSGGLLEIPRIFLDPRRPITMTIEHREEGLIPYSPELPIPSESIITKERPLLKTRGVRTSPAMLESTSLVFAYGLDLFFTRVTPSKTFDILKDDFDHLLIAGVLLFLTVASYICKLLAQRKALHAAWK